MAPPLKNLVKKLTLKAILTKEPEHKLPCVVKHFKFILMMALVSVNNSVRVRIIRTSQAFRLTSIYTRCITSLFFLPEQAVLPQATFAYYIGLR